ncbi:hypothetical protein D3C86_2004700 [compost metagenome]
MIALIEQHLNQTQPDTPVSAGYHNPFLLHSSASCNHLLWTGLPPADYTTTFTGISITKEMIINETHHTAAAFRLSSGDELYFSNSDLWNAGSFQHY